MYAVGCPKATLWLCLSILILFFLSPQKMLIKILTNIMIYSIITCVADNAQVAELADAQDLKSCGTFLPCRFDPGLGHHDGVG